MQNQKKIVIVDYGMGNLFSVQQAFTHLGYQTLASSTPREIASADALVLPGVGAFGDAMDNLKKQDLIQPIFDFIETGKPFLGICLGMQLLFSESEEFGNHKGLNLIEGAVRKFPSKDSLERKLKVPQIAWNKIHKPENISWKATPFEHIHDGEFMYFIHSYYTLPAQKNDEIATTNYGFFQYCSAVKKHNIFAVQFHPEKSANKGLKIYDEWSKAI